MDLIIKIILNNLTMLITLGMLFTILFIFMSIRRQRVELEQRIQRVARRRLGPNASRSVSDVSVRRQRAEHKGIFAFISRRLPDSKVLGNRLERAGKKITAQQYLMRRLYWFVGIMVVVHVIFGKPWVMGAAAGIVIGVALPFKLLSMAVDKKTKEFLKLFPDAIDLIVRGLRSGLPVSESLVVVSQEVPDPVGSTFTNVSNTMKLGVPLERSLQETAKKLDITEFNFFTTSIILQRETGGNLAEILSNLSDVLRGRFIMRMKIRAMSSEARASAMIIGALPFVVFTLITLISPGYMEVLYTDPRGKVCAGIALGMMGFGMWVMRRMTQFEI